MSATEQMIGRMITATSNERYRLKKLMKGNDGTTYPDALNEKTDDSIDAGSSMVKATYQDGNLMSIYNDGRPMDDNDRLKYIQLDSEKLEDSSDEEDSVEQIGKYGIGATKARARFSGRNGMEVTTSVDSEGNGHQILIDMSSLLDKEKTPDNCWTGDSDHKPTWTNIVGECSYEKGVTTEYMNPSSHNFDKSSVIIEQMKQYQFYVQDGVRLQHTFDDVEYTIPLLISPENVQQLVKSIKIHKDNKGRYHYQYDKPGGGTGFVAPKGRGYGFVEGIKDGVGEPSETNFTFTFPKISHIVTKEMKESKEMHYAYMNAISNMCQNVMVEESGRVIIKCGQNNLYLDNVDNNDLKVKSSTQIVREAFFNGINIKQDKRILSTIPLSIYGDGKRASGDMDCQNLYEYASKTWETSSNNEVNIAEEIKSHVTIEMIPGLDKVLKDMCTSFNKYLKDEIKKYHDSLLTEEEKKNKKEEVKKKKRGRKKKVEVDEIGTQVPEKKQKPVQEEVVTLNYPNGPQDGGVTSEPEPEPEPEPVPSTRTPAPPRRMTFYQGEVLNEDGNRIVEEYLKSMKGSGSNYCGIDLEIVNKIIKKNDT